MWVILLGLLVVFWQQKILEAIGNRIGKFVALEEDWESKLDRRYAKILVELDLRNGLFEELKIFMHGSFWWQRLDYWKLPFRCFNCREVGHMHKEHPKAATKPMFKKTWVRKQANKEQKNKQEDNAQEGQEPYHLYSEKMSREELNVEKEKQSVKTKIVWVRKSDSKGMERIPSRNHDERTQEEKVHAQSLDGGEKDKALTVDNDDGDMQKDKLEKLEESVSSAIEPICSEA